MMKRLIRNRKAVSPVIATVLMILVTMVGMTLLFAFVTSYTDTYKAGIGSSVMESLTVDDIWLSPRTNNYNSEVHFSVYNAGKVDSQITSIYVNGLKLTETDESNGNFNLQIQVPVGEHSSEQIVLYWYGHTWQPGNTYTFTIATQKGSTFDITYTAP
jgi:flagellin-like protein